MKHPIIYRLAVSVLLLASLVSNTAQAQKPADVNYEIAKLYKLYDSSVYLVFNTLYDYSTDTVLNKYYKHETLQGEYNMYGSRCIYRIGNIDYLRNDSFSIAAYNDDKFLVVSRVNQVRGSSGVLPIRDLVDSLVNTYQEHYSVSVMDSTIEDVQDTTVDTLRVIKFIKLPNDSTSSYDYINITYDPVSYSLNAYEYGLRQPVELNEEDSSYVGEGLTWKVNFRIAFTNYRVSDADTKIFSEAAMIREEQPGIWVAAGKYAGYTLYWATDKVPKQIEVEN